MKNKTKKILAGVGLGLIGVTALTGCSSDITFNQADLDKAINGVNEYLETQNNYSSEFARNMLNDAITKAVFKAVNVTNYSSSVSQTMKDDVGNSISSMVSTSKVYYNQDTNTTKQYSKVISDEVVGYEVYREVKYAANPTIPEGTDEETADQLKLSKYTSKVYDLENKTWYETSPEERIRETIELEHVQVQISHLTELLNYCLLLTYSEDIVGDVVMNKIDDNTNEFIFARHYLQDMGEAFGNEQHEFYEYYQFRFVEDELTYLKRIVRCDKQFDGVMIAETNIDWNTTDFTVNTSECATKVDAPELLN